MPMEQTSYQLSKVNALAGKWTLVGSVWRLTMQLVIVLPELIYSVWSLKRYYWVYSLMNLDTEVKRKKYFQYFVEVHYIWFHMMS